MAAKKRSKKTTKTRAGRRATPKPKAQADPLQAERDELRRMRAEFEQEKQALEEERSLEDLNRKLAAGDLEVADDEPKAEPEPPPETEEQRIQRQREDARQQRRRKRTEEKRARQAPPAPASNVASIDEARSKKTAAEPATPPAPAERKPISLPLEELYQYKLEVLVRRLDEAQNAIRQPLLTKYSRLLEQELAGRARNDPACVKARQAQIACMSELREKLAAELPEGYAIKQVLTAESRVIAEYDPERAAQPFGTPGAGVNEEK